MSFVTLLVGQTRRTVIRLLFARLGRQLRQYDANGNLTSRTIGGVTTDFVYDDEDRRVQQTTGANYAQHV